jgi:hypothetical protein
MMKIGRKVLYVLAAATITAIPSLFLATPASATHSWGGYHWGRIANPFTLKLGDNVGSAWDLYLGDASGQWSTSAVLDTTVVTGTSDPKNCRPRSGTVQVCSAKYGFNGWLGRAQIWITSGHITQGAVKLNDSYFNLSTYNTPAWRIMVTCQEIGHTFGLDHQDENFTNQNLGTCMDYTNNPLGPPENTKPNPHDYDQLELIYAHLDNVATVGSASAMVANNPSDWGKAVRFIRDGRGRVFVKDLGAGRQMVTFVIWAPL